ncbi:MAG: hypothetical protein P4L36_09795 [Holophaga sp.]|nr:hypothetical protein [Holophaga sp.]
MKFITAIVRPEKSEGMKNALSDGKAGMGTVDWSELLRWVPGASQEEPRQELQEPEPEPAPVDPGTLTLACL